MSARDETCPYCNAVVQLPSGAPLGAMLTCSRCEERFPLKNVSASGGRKPPEGEIRISKSEIRKKETAGASDLRFGISEFRVGEGDSRPPLAVTPRRFTNRALGFTVLGVMGIMATVGLVFALNTKDFRRENDSGLKQSRSRKRPQQRDIEDALKVSPYSPLETPGVALLPENMDVLAGIHVRAALQESEGRRLLEREIPGLSGSVQSRILERIDLLTGIKIEELDHVAVGMRVRDTTLVLVVKTRQSHPYVASRVVDKLKAKRHPSARGAEIYRFQQELLPKVPQELLMNCVDEYTLILGWQADLKDITPSGNSKPKSELATLLEERVKPVGPVWLAGSVDAGQAQSLTQVLGLLGGVPEADRKAWLGVRASALWLTLDDKVTVHAVLRSADAGKRETIEKWMRQRLGDKPEVVLAGNDEWLTLQYRPGK